RALLLGQQHVGAFPAAQDNTVPGRVEVRRGDYVAPGAHRVDGGLVDQVGQVGAGEARGSAGDGVQVHAGVDLLATAVHGQDRGPLVDVRQRDDHLPVEPAGPEQGRVEDLRP